MGTSITVNVIGFTDWQVLPDGRMVREEVACMTKTEMAQERHKLAQAGKTIIGWYAQTKHGKAMLGAHAVNEVVTDKSVSHVRLVDCPICEKVGCVVCNHSGLTRNHSWNQWHQWQLDRFREEARKRREVHPAMQ